MKSKKIERILSRYLTGQANSQEMADASEWIENHKQEWEMIEQTWHAEYKKYPQFSISSGKKLLTLKLKPKQVQQSWYKLVATISLLLLTTLSIVWIVRQMNENNVIVIQTNENESKWVNLPDGSKVKLASGSKIQFNKVFENQRFVTLYGEAFFSVVSDPKHPFQITTSVADVKVLGTSFIVNADHSDIQVSVVSGKVSVYTQENQAILFPNQILNYTTGLDSFTIRNSEIYDQMSWVYQSFIFKDTPLSEVVRQIEKNFKVKVKWSNESLKSCLLTGTFHQATLEGLLDAIRYTSQIQYSIQNKEVILSGKGCDP